MKNQITIFYKKSREKEFILKRVLIQDDDVYTLVSYWSNGKEVKAYKSNLRLSQTQVNKYLLQCRKDKHFSHIENQFVM
mgnify:CR=1 FL=1|jgi:hypothetical protein